MWLLQRKNLHKKHLLWLKIIGFCLSIHIIALFWVFCVYQENKYMHAFSVNKKMDYSAPILFCSLPAQKQQETIKTVSKSTTKTVQKTSPVKPAAQNKTPITAVKTEVKPYSAKATKGTFAVTSNVKQETKATTVETKKITQAEKTEPKKVEIAKVATPTPVENNSSSFAKATADTAKAIDVTSPIVPVTEEKPYSAPSSAKSFGGHGKASVSAKATTDTTKGTSDVTSNVKKEPAPALPQNAQVSNNFREVEALRRGAQLQKELVQKWQPPIGVSPDCTCDISFFVTKKGTIEQLKMVKSSGVMMFDISARQALFSMKMPQWTYGKPLIISFKQ